MTRTIRNMGTATRAWVRDNIPTDDRFDQPTLPVLPLLYFAAIAVAVTIITVTAGGRLGLVALLFAAVVLATRLPRALPACAALALLFAVGAVLASKTPAVPVAEPHSTHHVIVGAAAKVVSSLVNATKP
jgi:hypothetical protein